VIADELEPDGSRRYVAQGLRTIERPDGSLETADVWLPPSRSLRVIELPERLGGGFLFAAATGGSTLIYGAPSWTGTLRPVARLEGEVEQVLPGFDRLYLMLGRASQWIALDPATGQSLDLGSLPRSAGYGQMAFADEWFGVVITPYRGALATFDAGSTWHPLGAAVTSAAPLDGNVLITVSGKRMVLGSDGVMLPIDGADATSDRVKLALAGAEGGQKKSVALRPLGPRPLETAVLHGFSDRPGSALVASGGLLARVRLADGAIVERMPDAYQGASPCDAVPLGASIGFVCGEPGGGTTVFAFERPLSLRSIVAFSGPRRVAASGNGALVVSDGCETERGDPSAVCVFPRVGEPYEVPVKERGVERLVALEKGGIARLLPPHVGRAGTLTLVGTDGRERSIALKVPKTGDKAVLSILGDGLWLDSFQEGPGGELRGWGVGGNVFVGIRVKPDGTVNPGAPQQYLDRALLSGPFGFVISRAGAALETTDGGFEWSDAELPAEPDFRVQRTMGAAQGCSALGCAVSGWLRVGWGMGPRGRLAVAEPPGAVRVKQTAGNRWSLDCVPAGVASRPALPIPEAANEREQGPPSPVAEVAAPSRPASERVFDAGSEPEARAFRAYAWGPPLEAWPKNARWLVRAVDPHSIQDGVWSTTAGAVPWPSPESAADAFGQSLNGPPASFRFLSDPVAHAGLFIVNARGQSEVFLAEEGRDPLKLRTQGALGMISSFARAGRSSYVGALGEGPTLRVYRVEGTALTPLGEYLDVVPRTELARLAPSTRGDGLALWVRSGNYFLYPLDPKTGALDEPIEITADALGSMPRPCNPDEDGYVVGDALSTLPGLGAAPRIDLYDASVQVGNSVEVRLIVSGSDFCTDGVAAPVGGTGARTKPSPEKKTTPGVPLVLNDPRPGGTRRLFRCWD
jgi:hypothetical protein